MKIPCTLFLAPLVALAGASCSKSPENLWRVSGLRDGATITEISKPLPVTAVVDGSRRGASHALFREPVVVRQDALSADALRAWGEFVGTSRDGYSFRRDLTTRSAVRSFLGKLGVDKGSGLMAAVGSIAIEGKIGDTRMITDMAKFQSAINTTDGSDSEFESLARDVRMETGQLIERNALVGEGRYRVVVKTSTATNVRIVMRMKNDGKSASLAAGSAAAGSGAFPALAETSPFKMRVLSAGPSLELNLTRPVAGELEEGWLLATKDGSIVVTPLADHRVDKIVSWAK